MSKSIKRVLAMLLSVCMVVGMMPTLAFAAIAGAQYVESISIGGKEVTFGKSDSKIDTDKELFSATYSNLILTNNFASTTLKLDKAQQTYRAYYLISKDDLSTGGSISGTFDSSESTSQKSSSTNLNALNSGGTLSKENNKIYFKIDDGTNENVEYCVIEFTNIHTNPLAITPADIKVTALKEAVKGNVTLKIENTENEEVAFWYKVVDSGSVAANQYKDEPFEYGGYTRVDAAAVTGDGVTITAEDGKYIEVYGVDASRNIISHGVSSSTVNDGWVDAPEFAAGGDSYQLTKGVSTAEFTLSNDSATRTYKVYATKNAPDALESITAESDQKGKLTLTLTGHVPDEDTIYWISAEENGTESSGRTPVTVKVYIKNQTTGLKKATVDGKEVDVAGKGAATFGEAAPIQVTVDYTGTNGKPSSVVLEPVEGAKVVGIGSAVESEAGIKGYESADDGASITVPTGNVKWAASPQNGEVWAKVTSEDGSAKAYYHFVIISAAPSQEKDIKSISVNGCEGTVGAATADNDGTSVAKAIPVTVSVPKGTSGRVSVDLTTAKGTTVGYEVAKNEKAAYLNYGEGPVDNDGKKSWANVSVGTDEYLYIKVTAQNGSSLIYKVILEEERFTIAAAKKTETTGVSITNGSNKSAPVIPISELCMLFR